MLRKKRKEKPAVPRTVGFVDNSGNLKVTSDASGKFIRKELIDPPLSETESKLIYDKVISSVISEATNRKNGYGYSGHEAIDMTNFKKIASDHFVHDLFNLYMEEITEYDMKVKKNPVKAKILNKLHDPTLNLITNGSYISSFVFTKNLSEVIVKYFTENLSDEDLENLMQALESTDQDPDLIIKVNKILKGMDTGAKLNKSLNDAIDKSKSDIKKIESMGEGASDGYSELHTVDSVYEIMNFLKAMNLDKNKIDSFLKNVMNRSINYFSPNVEYLEDNIFNTEDFEGIEELIEFSDDDLLRISINDLDVQIPDYQGKIIVYIDASGSMGNSTTPGSLLVLAKATAMRMMEMGYVTEVYFFSDRVFDEPMKTPIDIAKNNAGGGTSFDRVVEHAAIHGLNSVIITDGQDSVATYSDKLYWIGVGGAQLGYLARYSDEGKKYIENNQCIHFDGDTVKDVHLGD